MKRLFSLLLSVLLIISLFCTAASATQLSSAKTAAAPDSINCLPNQSYYLSQSVDNDYTQIIRFTLDSPAYVTFSVSMATVESGGYTKVVYPHNGDDSRDNFYNIGRESKSWGVFLEGGTKNMPKEYTLTSCSKFDGGLVSTTHSCSYNFSYTVTKNETTTLSGDNLSVNANNFSPDDIFLGQLSEDDGVDMYRVISDSISASIDVTVKSIKMTGFSLCLYSADNLEQPIERKIVSTAQEDTDYDYSFSLNRGIYYLSMESNDHNSLITSYNTGYYELSCTGHGLIKVGDADSDGTVTIMDATKIQLTIAALDSLVNEQIAAADADFDNDITILDVTRIQLLLANLIDKFGPPIVFD